MPEREQRRLTTILAADVAGYSRLTGADEEGTLRRLRALRVELIDPAIAANRGRVFKTAGDGVLIEFASVVDAARCAIEVQRAMARRNEDFVPEKRIEFRIGIHVGDVLVEADGDLLGDGVNIAARLEGIADPGGICLSDDAWRQVRDRLQETFIDLGDKELKNIARPVRVFAIAPAAAPPPSDASRRFSSPPPASGGRLGGGLAAEQGPPRLSIVVLPFANIGGDPEQEYFVDGVTESLTTDLSRIGGSFVIARNTAFTYKGKPIDVKQIGREMNVRYVLEGSVQRAGNRLRVNVQLIDAETGNHLWAERFDKPVADLFDMQDEIVARLANQLNAQLIAAEARRAEQSPHPDSMDFCFRGMVSLNKGETPDLLSEARGYFDQALALDPGNVEAMLGRATADVTRGSNFMMVDRAVHLPAIEAALSKVLSLAPGNARAHVVMGSVYAQSKRQVQAMAELEHALALDPNLAHAHALIGATKITLGRSEETEAHMREALRLSPRDVRAATWMLLVGAAKIYLGRDEEAVAWCRRAIDTNRNRALGYFALAAALAHLGRLDEARAALQSGFAFDPGFTVSRLRSNAASDDPTYLGQRERMYDGMRKAGVSEG